MSIGQSHAVNKLTAESKPLAGQKLLALRYRDKAGNGKKLPSVCISVPRISQEELFVNLGILAPVLSEYLHSVQIEIAKSIHSVKGTEFTSLHDVDISPASIVKFLTDAESGGRFTEQTVTDWFNSTLADAIGQLVRAKIGYPDDVIECTTEQLETVNKNVRAQCERLCKLVDKRKSLSEIDLRAMRKLFNLVDMDSDSVAVKLLEKLDSRLAEYDAAVGLVNDLM